MDDDMRFGTDPSLQDDERGDFPPGTAPAEDADTRPVHSEDTQPVHAEDTQEDGLFSGEDDPARHGTSGENPGEAPQQDIPQQDAPQPGTTQPEITHSGTPQPDAAPEYGQSSFYEAPESGPDVSLNGDAAFDQAAQERPHDFDDDEPKYDTQTGEPLNKPKKKYPGIILTFAVTVIALGAFIYSVMPGKLPSAGIPADDEVEAETELASVSTEEEETQAAVYAAQTEPETETEAETESEAQTENTAPGGELPVSGVPEFKTEGVALSAGADLADLVEEVMPGIVSVTGAGKDTVAQIMLAERDLDGTDAGSGVIVYMDEESCYIVTNAFIVENAEQVTVGFSVRMDGTEQLADEDTLADAETAATDPESDLALVRVKKEDINETVLEQIRPSVMGDSGKLRVGQRTIAVGNAAGRGLSATEGILSSMGRERSARTGEIHVYLQTDASINSGNYGGALLNGSGEVIGINIAGVSETSGDGIGYAFPVNDMVDSIARMAGSGADGMPGEAADPEETQETEESQEPEEAQAADETEAHAGRIGLAIADDPDEDQEIAEAAPQTEEAAETGETVEAAETEETAVIREEKPSEEETEGKAGSGGKLGIQAVEITPESRIINRIPEGVYIMEVTAGSGAAAAGLRQGDVITAVNDTSVASISDLTGLLGKTKAGDKVKVFFVRPDDSGEYNSRQVKSVVVTLQ